jgi:poly-gamma-glutamate synthase PgsB/CapB
VEPWTPLIALGAAAGAAAESWLHLRRLSRISYRIHVNGTRGKSGVTRLVAAGLRAGGLRVIAKTTGAAPRVLFPDGSEVDLRRGRRPALREYIGIVRLAARHRADALVVECMAVRPEYQRAAEHRLLHSTIGVLTNAGLDHLGVMGVTLDEVTAALAATIPAGGTLVTPSPVPEFWGCRATALATDVRAVTPAAAAELPHGYVEWPINVALALEVCAAIGVDRATALAGMRDVRPDPGALKVWRLSAGGRVMWLTGSFGANDPVSTRQAIERVRSHVAPAGRVVGILNTRADRGERTLQWCEALLAGQVGVDALVLTGPHAAAALRRLHRRGWTVPGVAVASSAAASVMAAVAQFAESGDLVVGMGNVRGPGAVVLEAWRTMGEEVVLHNG